MEGWRGPRKFVNIRAAGLPRARRAARPRPPPPRRGRRGRGRGAASLEESEYRQRTSDRDRFEVLQLGIVAHEQIAGDLTAAGDDGDVLLGADAEADRRPGHGRAEIEFPNLLAVGLVKADQPAVLSPDEDEASGGGDGAAGLQWRARPPFPHRLLAGRVDGTDDARVLFGRVCGEVGADVERAALVLDLLRDRVLVAE